MYKIYDDPHTEIGLSSVLETGVLRNLSHLLVGDLQLHLNMPFRRIHVKLQETTVMINSVAGDGADSKQKAVFDRLLRKKVT
jgi:hypothetical protein